MDGSIFHVLMEAMREVTLGTGKHHQESPSPCMFEEVEHHECLVLLGLPMLKIEPCRRIFGQLLMFMWCWKQGDYRQSV